jgi:anti-anti-sigma factor
MSLEQIGSVTVYRVQTTRLFSSEDIQALRSDLQAAVEASSRPMLAVDFSSVEFVSSRGLGVLVAIYKASAAKHGQTVLFCANQAIEHVLTTTKLDTLLKIFPTQAAALAALGAAST